MSKSKGRPLMAGVVPQPPCILCKDELTAQFVRESITEAVKDPPPIQVAETWPDHWLHNAAIYMPLIIIGATGTKSFAISADLSEIARGTLNAIIQWKRKNDGENPTIHQLTKTMGVSARQVAYGVAELETNGIIGKKKNGAIFTKFGHWEPDVTKAALYDVNITVYE